MRTHRLQLQTSPRATWSYQQNPTLPSVLIVHPELTAVSCMHIDKPSLRDLKYFSVRFEDSIMLEGQRFVVARFCRTAGEVSRSFTDQLKKQLDR